MSNSHNSITGKLNNSSLLSRATRYIPLIIGVLILIVIAALAPWDQIKELLEKVPFTMFLALAGFSALYYGSKSIRFWYILRALDIHLPLSSTALLYLSGQLVSFLPAGEFYRSVLLKKYYNVSISKSSPSVTFQGIVEAIVLITLSLIGAFIIGRNQLVVGVVGVLLLLFIAGLQLGWFNKSHTLINKLPFISVNKNKFQQFIEGHQVLFTPQYLLPLIAFSLIPVFSGIGILYLASHAIGFDINLVKSMISYTLPAVISGLSFLPGGIGITEGGSIGMLQLFGATAAEAMTITLLIRMFTLVAGLVYGTIAQLVLHSIKKPL